MNPDHVIEAVLELAARECAAPAVCAMIDRTADSVCRPCWARMVVEAAPAPHANDIALAFDQFWEVYPRKVGKGDARKAFLKAAKKVSLDRIGLAAYRFAEGITGADPQFVPYPATWLNAERWEDETVQDDQLARMRAEMERRGYKDRD